LKVQGPKNKKKGGLENVKTFPDIENQERKDEAGIVTGGESGEQSRVAKKRRKRLGKK